MTQYIARRDFLGKIAASGLGLLTAPLTMPAAESLSPTKTSLQEVLGLLNGHPDVASVSQHEVTGARSFVIHLRQIHPTNYLKSISPSSTEKGREQRALVDSSQKELERVTKALLDRGVLQEIFVEGLDKQRLLIFNRDFDNFKRMKEIDRQLPSDVKKRSMDDITKTLEEARANNAPYLPALEELNQLLGKGISISEAPFTWLAVNKLRYSFNVNDIEPQSTFQYVDWLDARFKENGKLAVELEGESERLKNILKEHGTLSREEMARFTLRRDLFLKNAAALERHFQSDKFRAEVFEKREPHIVERIGLFAKESGHRAPFLPLILGASHDLRDDVQAWNRRNPGDRLGLLEVTVKSLSGATPK